MSKKKPNPRRYPDGFGGLLKQGKLLDEIVIQYENHGYDRSVIPPTLGDIADAVGHEGEFDYSLHAAVISWLHQNNKAMEDPWIEFNIGVAKKSSVRTVRDHCADAEKRWIEKIDGNWYRVRESKKHRYLKD